jgi:hypothetical protein
MKMILIETVDVIQFILINQSQTILQKENLKYGLSISIISIHNFLSSSTSKMIVLFKQRQLKMEVNLNEYIEQTFISFSL